MKRLAITLFCLLAGTAAMQAQKVKIPEIKPLKEIDEDISPAMKHGEWGYANAKGKFIIKSNFDEVEPFVPLTHAGVTMGLARIRFGEKWNYLTRDQRYLFAFDYDSLTPFDSGGNCLGVIDGKTVLLGVKPLDPGKNKKQIPTFEGVTLLTGLDKVEPFRGNGLAWALEDGKWGMLTRTGEWAVKPRFDSWKADEKIGLNLVTVKDKLGCVDENGNEVIPIRYDAISFDDELGLVKVGVAEKLGLLTQQGRIVLEPEFEGFSLDSARRIIAHKDGKIGVFEPDGSERYPCVFDEAPIENAAGYVEAWDGIEPALYLPGRKLLTAQAVDEALHKDLGPAEYAASDRLPAWLKRHLDRKPQMVEVTTDLSGEPVRLDLSEETRALATHQLSSGKPLSTVLKNEYPDVIYYWEEGDFLYAGYRQEDGLYGFDIIDLAENGRSWHGTTAGAFTFLKREQVVAETGEGEGGAVRSLTPHCFSYNGGPHVPVLRYEYHNWGGKPYVTLGSNVFPEGDAPAANWNVHLTGDTQTIILGDFMHSTDPQFREIHSVKVNPPGPSGIAVYEMLCQVVENTGGTVRKDAPMTVAYGFVGLTRPFFTQALFSEVRAPQGASAEVTIDGVRNRLTLNQIRNLDPFAQPDEDPPLE